LLWLWSYRNLYSNLSFVRCFVLLLPIEVRHSFVGIGVIYGALKFQRFQTPTHIKKFRDWRRQSRKLFEWYLKIFARTSKKPFGVLWPYLERNQELIHTVKEFIDLVIWRVRLVRTLFDKKFSQEWSGTWWVMSTRSWETETTSVITVRMSDRSIQERFQEGGGVKGLSFNARWWNSIGKWGEGGKGITPKECATYYVPY
jgi:hypothetical protein